MTQERVLIVEDEENERTGLAELVSSWGYRTDTAADGLEALEKVATFSPAIVVTDVKMPRMGGIELAERLADLSTSVAVVMVTLRSRLTSGACAPFSPTSRRYSTRAPKMNPCAAVSATKARSDAWWVPPQKCWRYSTSLRWSPPAPHPC